MGTEGATGTMVISKSSWDSSNFNYLFRPPSPDIAEGMYGGVNMPYDHTLHRAGEAKAAGYGVVFKAGALPEPWKRVGTFAEWKFKKDLRLGVGTG